MASTRLSPTTTLKDFNPERTGTPMQLNGHLIMSAGKLMDMKYAAQVKMTLVLYTWISHSLCA